MADTTTDTTQPAAPAAPAAPAMDPKLFAYLKSILPPTFADKDVMDTYQATVKKAAEQGTDIAAQPPQIQAQLFKRVIDATSSAKPDGTGAAPAAPQQLDAVTVTGQRPAPTPTPPVQQAAGGNFGVGPQGVTAGTAATDAQFGAPGATSARLNASADPAAMKAAADELYRLQGGNSLMSRFTGGMQAATASGSGGAPLAYGEYTKRLADIDAAHTTGLVAAQQEAQRKALEESRNLSTSAQTNSAGAQTQAQQGVQFGGEQAIRNNAAALSNQGTAATLELGDPTSPASKAALEMATPVLHAMGVDPKHFAGQSASTIMAYISGVKPTTDLQKQLVEQAQKTFSNWTDRITANANAGLTNQQMVGQGQKNQTMGAATGASMDPKNPTSPGVIKQNIKDQQLNYAPEGFTQSPAKLGVQTGGAEAVNSLRKQVTTYDTTGVGPATDVALKALQVAGLKDTGIPGKYLEKLPTSQAQAIKTALIGHNMANGMDANAASANADALMQSGTPAQLAQQLARGKATQDANKTFILPAQEAWLRAHGSLQGFVPPAVTSYVNSKGQVRTTDNPRTDDAQLRKDGYRPIVSGAK